MPWSANDAERHTLKATTLELQELWAKIASALGRFTSRSCVSQTLNYGARPDIGPLSFGNISSNSSAPHDPPRSDPQRAEQVRSRMPHWIVVRRQPRSTIDIASAMPCVNDLC